ncbi:MAG: IPT/TIG domain-containing protein [Candidatus Hydrogenedentes bacterium]|nr:IPT/TIG domain-containing protein [Candidatus Hydrogenedentota bacterium]
MQGRSSFVLGAVTGVLALACAWSLLLVDVSPAQAAAAAQAQYSNSGPPVLSPPDGAQILVPQGKIGIPVALVVDTDALESHEYVSISVDEVDLGILSRGQTTIALPDITILSNRASHTLKATRKSGNALISESDTAFQTRQVEADANGDGLPDDPFALTLSDGGYWRDRVAENSGNRDVIVGAIPRPGEDGSAGESLVLALSHPDGAEGVLLATVPAGFLAAGEKGLVIVQACAHWPAFSNESSNTVAPGRSLVSEGFYVAVAVVVSTDNGQTYHNADSSRWEANPIEVRLSGLAVEPGDNVRFLARPLSATGGEAAQDAPLALVLDDGQDEWRDVETGTRTGDGEMAVSLRGPAVLAPVETPGHVRIARVDNKGAGASGFSTGGERVTVDVANVSSADAVGIAFDGVNASIEAKRIESDGIAYDVILPPANSLAAPAAFRDVDVMVTTQTETDVRPGGFRYLGPALLGVSPASGEQAGGDEIQISGQGFAQESTIALGQGRVENVTRLSDTEFHGISPAHAAGQVELTVTNPNNYMGTMPGAFTYLPNRPVMASAWPPAIPADGGYRVRLEGAFVDPSLLDAPGTRLQAWFFSGANPVAALETTLLDNDRIDALTPPCPDDVTGVYVALELADGTVLNSDIAALRIQAPRISVKEISPRTAPLNDASTVALTVAGLTQPLTAAPRVYFGAQSAEVLSYTTSEELTTLTVEAPPGERSGAVDVRVEDGADPSRFGILTAGGFAYLPDAAPSIEIVEPSKAWAFGGIVARITGVNFQAAGEQVSRVYFNGVEAAYAPSSAGYVHTDTTLDVVVPVLDDDVEPGQASVDAIIAVENPDGSVCQSSTTFTYVRRDLARQAMAGGDTAEVVTSAFVFDAATGSGPRLIAPDAQADSGAQVSGAIITLPPLQPVDTAGAKQIFVLARASRETQAFGLDAVQAGQPVQDAMNFDIHLYRGDYPFDELALEFSPHENPPTLTFAATGPAGESLLSSSLVKSGGVALYTLPGLLDYGDVDFPVLSPMANDGSYQWSLAGKDAVPVVTEWSVDELPVSAISFGITRLGAMALRTNAFMPETLASNTLYRLAPDSSKEGALKGGSMVKVLGRGLAWPERIVFGDVVAYERGGERSKSLRYATDTELHVVAPALDGVEEGRTVDIFITLPVNEARTEFRTVRVVQGYRYKQIDAELGLLATLLAIPLALLGLFAGGKSGGGGGGPCFIATAAYGTPLAESIEVLRVFRDTWLLDTAAGTAFVDAYYHLSPAVADVVAANPLLAAIVRIALIPVIAVVRVILAVPQFSLLMFALTCALLAVKRRFFRPGSKAAAK